ncbi:hypothetical protein V8G54_025617 [Vigna mungo]|uniref:Uncharacterized protein n=1 Tax=Vigna mungo TaxID=3915 RepID=A0AAQ3MYR6_VIGMU
MQQNGDLMADTFHDSTHQTICYVDGFCVRDLERSPQTSISLISNEVIQSCKQGDSIVSQYYTRLQIILKELSSYKTVLVCTCKSPCTCGLLTKIQQERNDDSVIKFLCGLNDEFSQVRSQIILMEPMPTLPKTFSLDPQNKTFNTSRGAFSSRGRGCATKFGGRAKYCDHCKRTNHTSDNCWIKYGLPQGYKHNIKPDSAPSNPFAHLTDGVSLTPNDSTADKTQIQCNFTQEQYDVILGLLKQSQPLTPRMANINQCIPQSSTSFALPTSHNSFGDLSLATCLTHLIMGGHTRLSLVTRPEPWSLIPLFGERWVELKRAELTGGTQLLAVNKVVT